MMKKIFSVLLALALILSCICTTTFATADNQLTVKLFHFNEDGGNDPTGNEVTGTEELKAGDIVIAAVSLVGSGSMDVNGCQFQLNFDSKNWSYYSQSTSRNGWFYKSSTELGDKVVDWTQKTNTDTGALICGITSATNTNVQDEIVFVYIAFQVNENAVGGSTSFSFDEDYETSIYKLVGDVSTPVDFELSNPATVSIEGEDQEDTIAILLESESTYSNVGEEVSVGVYATSTKEILLRSYQFDIKNDSNLVFNDFSINNDLNLTPQIEKNGTKIAATFGSDQDTTGLKLLAKQKTKLGTISFSTIDELKNAEEHIDSVVTTVNFDDTIISIVNEGKDVTPDVSSCDITIYDLRPVLSSGVGGKLNGKSSSINLYANYNEKGLYTDKQRTTKLGIVTPTADDGYRLSNLENENLWNDGTNGFSSLNDILNVVQTKSVTYTLQTVETVKLNYTADENGTIDDTLASKIVDKNGLVSIYPTVTANEHYTFDGWYVGEIKIDTKNYRVTGDTTFVAKFIPGSFVLNTPNLTNVQLSDISGVSNGKVEYNTPITFKVTPDSSYYITTVSYSINDGNTTTLVANNGLYTIPGSSVTGNVTIIAEAAQYHTVTFAPGHTDLTQTILYVKDGVAGYYTSISALTGTSDGLAPTLFNADTGYRLSDKTGESLWQDENSNQWNSESIRNAVFSEDATITAQTVKIWTVTYEVGENGSFASEGSHTEIADDGTVIANLQKPEIVPDPGYELDKWTGTISGGTIVTSVNADTTIKATFKDSKYNVIFPSIAGISFTGENTATHATTGDYTFNVKATTAKITKITYRIGNGSEIELKSSDDGIGKDVAGENFSIPLSSFTSDVTILVVSNATYNITINIGENGSVNGVKGGEGSSVVKTFDANYVLKEADFSVVPDAGYIVDVQEYIGKTVVANASYSVSFKDGTYSLYEEGQDPVSINHGQDYTFTPKPDEGKIVLDISAKINETEISADNLVKNTDGSYTIKGDAIIGDVVVTYKTIDSSVEFTSYNQYMAGKKNCKIFILKADKISGEKYTLSGYGDMYYSSRYNGYVYFVSTSETKASISSKLSKVEGNNVAIDYSGDINGSGKVTAADAGIVNDILFDPDAKNFEYTVDDLMRFKLDVCGNDISVSTQDIMWILEEAVGLSHNL